ncbi:VCBS domain-containing protein, partial [Limnohabitans sp. 15K]|uniref:VCBS domain-containing protein n=1 Tax=Limnohabitans sp. 15K TaxID=1100706 RepID=UPI000CB2670E
MSSSASSLVLNAKTLQALLQRARALLSLSKINVTASTLHFALIYLIAKEASAATPTELAEPSASVEDDEAHEILPNLLVEASTDDVTNSGELTAQTIDQAREQLRDLIEAELAHGRVARGLSEQQIDSVEQAANTPVSSGLNNAVATLPPANGVVVNSQAFDLGSLPSMAGGLLLAAAGIAGGGGGGGSVLAKVVLASMGIVADGYIKGATVTLLDAQGNVLATTTTDANGRYQFDGELAQKAFKIVASGGVDVSTGLKFDVTLSAPAGAGVVNPLTTLVQSYMEANPGTSAASASLAIKKVLGISGSEDLLQTDPIAQALTTTGLAQISAIALQAKAAQIANLLVTGAAAVVVSKGGSTEAAVNSILDSLTQQIVKAASAATPTVLDLTSAPIVSGLLGLTGAVVDLIASGNNVSANSLQGIYEFQKAVQDDLANALLTGNLSAQAVQALDALLRVVSVGQKVVNVELSPLQDTGSNASDGVTNIANPTIRVDLASIAGTARLGNTVEVKLEGETLGSAPIAQIDLDRGYLEFSLRNFTQSGAKTVAVVVTDPVSVKAVASGFKVVTVDLNAPEPLVLGLARDTGLSSSDNITSLASVQVLSKLEAGGAWQYSADGGVTWSGKLFSPSVPLTGIQDGLVTLLARQVDVAGNLSAVSSLRFQLDTTAPAMPGLALGNGKPAGSASTDGALSIQAEAGATVQYSANYNPAGVPGNGTWVDVFAPIAGSNTVYVRQTDAAGNASLPASLNFDFQPPDIKLTLSIDTPENSAPDRITSDGLVVVGGLKTGDSWSYQINGGDWVVGQGNTIAVTGDGNKVIEVKKVDAVTGKVSETASLKFLLDSSAPTAPTVALANGKAAGASTTDGTLVVIAEQGAKVEYSTDYKSDGAKGNGTWLADFKAVSGNNTVYVRQVDVAGNASSPSTFSFKLVNQLPVTPPTVEEPPVPQGITLALRNDTGTNGGDKITNVGEVQVNNLDTTLPWEFKTNAGVWQAGTGNFFTVQNLSPSAAAGVPYTVQVRQGIGPTEKLSTEFSFRLDTTAPADASIGRANLATNSGLATDDITNVGTFQIPVVSLDEGARLFYKTSPTGTWTQATKVGSNLQFTVTGDNPSKTVFVRVEDAAGNTSGETSYVFKLDSQTPIPTLNFTDTGASDGKTNNGTVNFAGLEAGSSLSYSLNGAAFVSLAVGTTSLEIPASASAPVDGEAINLVLKQTDVAGNSSTSSPLSFTLDKKAEAPVVELKTDTPQAGNINSLSDFVTSNSALKVTGVEVGATIQYNANGEGWSDEFTAKQGSNTVLIRQTDGAGNTSDASAALTFTYDSQKPVLTSVSYNNTPGHDPALTLNTNDSAASTVTFYQLNGGTATSTFPAAYTLGDSLDVWQVDLAGNKSEAVRHVPKFTIAPLSGDKVLSATEKLSPLVISGTTDVEFGQTVTVVFNGKTYTGAVAGGKWSVSVPQVDVAALSDGNNYGIQSINVANAAGNSFTSYIADTSANALSVIAASSGQDGYITGALIFADKNNDGVLQAGEFTSLTDSVGGFSLPSNGSLVMRGGTDVSTGLGFESQYEAPQYYRVINPITTLIQKYIALHHTDSAQPVTKAEITTAETWAKSLGLFGVSVGAGIDLKTYDPFRAATETGASSAAQAEAISYQKIALELSNLMDVGAMFVQTVKASGVPANQATELSDRQAISVKLVQVLAQELESHPGTTIGAALTSDAFVQTVLENTAKALLYPNTTLPSGVTVKLSVLADVLAAANGAISAAGGAAVVGPINKLQDAIKVQSALQGPVSTQLEEFAKTGTNPDLLTIGSNGQTPLQDAIAKAVTGVIVPARVSIDQATSTSTEGLYEGQDGGVKEFKVVLTRAGNVDSVFSLNYAITKGAGIDASDFVGNALPSGSVTFASGQTSLTLTLRVQGDTIKELSENFGVVISDPLAQTQFLDSSLSTPAPVSMLTRNFVILNDDPYNPTFNLPDAIDIVAKGSVQSVAGVSLDYFDAAAVLTVHVYSVATATLTSGGIPSIISNGQSVLTLTGNLEKINADLAALSVSVPATETNAYLSFDAIATNGAHTGASGTDDISVTLHHVAQLIAPTSLPTNILAGEPTNIPGFKVSDLDGDSLTVTLTPTGGVLSLGSMPSGLGVVQNDNGSWVLSGSARLINQALDTLAITASEFGGASHAVTVSAVVDDGDPITVEASAVTLETTALPAASNVEVPDVLTVSAGVVSSVSGITVGDIDSPNVTVTLSPSGGLLSFDVAPASLDVTASVSGFNTVLTGDSHKINQLLESLNFTASLDARDGSISVTVDDGNPNSAPGAGAVAIEISANAPPEAGGNLQIAAASAVMEDTAKQVTISGFNLVNPDGSPPGAIRIVSINGASISSGGTPVTLGLGGQVLALNSEGQLTLTVTPSANRDQPITFNYTVVDPLDPRLNSAVSTITLPVTAVNDAPVIAPNGLSYSYTENASPVQILQGLTIVDVDSTMLAGATVRISANADGSEVFAATTAGTSIAADWSIPGVLTLSGTASLSEYQSVLRSVTFKSSSESPSTLTRAIEVKVTDNSGSATADSSVIGRTVAVVSVNDAPVIARASTAIVATEQTALSLKGIGLSISDVDSGDKNITVKLSVVSGQIDASAAPGDGLSFTGSGTNNLTIIGTIDQVQKLFAASGGVGAISYTINSDTPPGADRLTVSVNDGGARGQGGVLQAQASYDLSLLSVNDAPVLALGASTGLYAQSVGNVLLAPLANLADVDGSFFTSANVSISTGYIDKDVLTLSSAAKQTLASAGFDFKFEAGKLSFTALTSGTAISASDLQSVLRGVTFSTTSDNVTASASRTITYTVRDAYSTTEDALNLTASSNIALTLQSTPYASIAAQTLVFTGDPKAQSITADLSTFRVLADSAPIAVAGGNLFAVTAINASASLVAVQMLGSKGNNLLMGSAGDDTISGGGGSDSLYGGDGKDTFIISAGDLANLSTLQGGEGIDTLKIVSPQTFDDASWLRVSGVERIVLGTDQGSYNFTLGTNAAVAFATSPVSGLDISGAGLVAADLTLNADTYTAALQVTGTEKADTFITGSGNDNIVGGAGNDTIDAGQGVDTLTGGAGSDTFVFKRGDMASSQADADVITDLSVGDKIDFSDIGLTEGAWRVVTGTANAAINYLEIDNLASLGVRGYINIGTSVPGQQSSWTLTDGVLTVADNNPTSVVAPTSTVNQRITLGNSGAPQEIKSLVGGVTKYFSVNDADANDIQTVKITASVGGISLAAGGPISAHLSSTASTIYLQGTAAQINTELALLRFTATDPGNAQITLSVTDRPGIVDPALATYLKSGSAFVTTPNASPVSSDDANSVAEDIGTPVTGNVKDNDTRGDGTDSQHTLLWTKTNTQFGSITLNKDTNGVYTGGYSYQLNNSLKAVQQLTPSEKLTETLTYQLTDKNGDTSYAKLIITIQGTDDLPIAVADLRSISEDTLAPLTGNVKVNDTPGDGTPADNVITWAGGTGAAVGLYGTITKNADGSYSYVLDNSMAVVQQLAPGDTPLQESFSYTLTDKDGDIFTSKLTITVNGTDDLPVASADVNELDEDSSVPVEGNVKANDKLGDGTSAENTIAWADGLGDTVGLYGTLTKFEDGSYSYVLDNSNVDVQQLAPGGELQEVFSYDLIDKNGGKSTAALTITIKGTNDAPEATADVDAVDEDSSFLVEGNVKDNDTLGDGTPADNTITWGQEAAKYGTITKNADGSYSYVLDNSKAVVQQLAPGQALSEIFNYTLTDKNGDTSTAALTITVNGTDDLPVAKADVNAVAEDSSVPVTGSVKENDTLGDGTSGENTITWAGGTGTAAGNYGTLTKNADGSYSYVLDNSKAVVQQLAPGDKLQESFSYTLTDKNGDISTAALTITVNGTNDATLAVADARESFKASSQPYKGNVIANDAQGDGVRAEHKITWGQEAAKYGTITKNPDGSYSYLVDATNADVQALLSDNPLQESFSYTLTDKNGDASTSVLTFTITSTDTNKPPVVGAYSQPMLEELANAKFWPIQLSGNIPVDDPDIGSEITANLLGTELTLSEGFTLPDGLTLGQLKSMLADPEFLTIQSGSVVGANAVPMSWVFSAPEANLDWLASGQTITISYNLQFDDGQIVLYKADENTRTTLKITITGTNDAPKVTAKLQSAASEGENEYTLNLLSGASDADVGETASLSLANVSYKVGNATASSAVPEGMSLNGATLTVNPKDAVFNNLNQGQVKTIVVSYDVKDAQGATVSQTQTITVTGTNDLPQVASQLQSVASEGGNPYTLNLMSGASDADWGETATLKLANVSYKVGDGPASSTLPAGLSLSGTTLTVNPKNAAFNSLAQGQVKTIVVSYDIKDVQDAAVSQSQTITITGTNDAPTVSGTLSNAVGQGSNPYSLNLLSGASDLDAGETATLSVANVRFTFEGTTGATAPAGLILDGATLKVDPKDVAFTSLLAGQSKTVVVSYDIKDSQGETVSQSLTITISGTNHLPQIVFNADATVVEDSQTTQGGLVVATFAARDEDGAVTVDFAADTNEAGYYTLDPVNAPGKVLLSQLGAAHVNSGRILPEIALTVTDAANVVRTASVTPVTVLVNDAPTITVQETVVFTEDQVGNAVNMVVARFTASDEEGATVTVQLSDTVHYALGQGDDAGKVLLTQAGVSLVNKGQPLPQFILTPFEGAISGQPVTVQPEVTPVNDAPTIALRSGVSLIQGSADNQAGLVVATYSVADEEDGAKGAVTVGFVAGTNAQNYYELGTLANAGRVLLTQAGVDFVNAGRNLPAIELIATDSGQLSSAKATATPKATLPPDTPPNHAPVVKLVVLNTFKEDAQGNAVGAVVATFSTSDEDGKADEDGLTVTLSDEVNYMLGEGADAGKVLLTQAGVDLVNKGQPLPEFMLTPNDGKTDGEPLTLRPVVEEVNDAPTITLNSGVVVVEDASGTKAGLVVATFEAKDEEGLVTVDFATGTNGQNYYVLGTEANAGKVLLTQEGADRVNAGQALPKIELEATDGSGVTVTASATPGTTLVNDAPTIALTSTVTVFEDSQTTQGGLVVATFAARDEDGAVTVDFAADTNEAGYYTLDPVNAPGKVLLSQLGAAHVNSGRILPEIALTVTDAANVVRTASVTPVTVLVNDAPTITVQETVVFTEDQVGNAVNMVVARFTASDEEGATVTVQLSDTVHYALGQGDDAGKVLLTQAGVSLVNKGQPLPQFILTPFEGAISGQPVTVQPEVTPVNDAPTIALRSGVSLIQGSADNQAGLVVATYSVADEEDGAKGAVTVGFVAGTNAQNYYELGTLANAGRVLLTQAGVDFVNAGRNLPAIELIATDSGQLSSAKATATPKATLPPDTPPNHAPVVKLVVLNTFKEDAQGNAVGAVVATFSTSDEDGKADEDGLTVTLSDEVNYMLGEGADAGKVLLTQAGVDLVNKGQPLPEFMLTPNDGKTDGEPLTLRPVVEEVNDAPTITLNSGVVVVEDASGTKAGLVVATFEAKDEEGLVTVDFATGTNGQNYYVLGTEANAGKVLLTQEGADRVNAGQALPKIELEATDGSGVTVTASATPGTTLVNDAPVLTGSAAELNAGLDNVAYTVSVAGLLKGYSDAEGQELSVVDLMASHGVVVDNKDGTYTITQAVPFSGSVNLTYTVSDGQGGNVVASQSYQVAHTNLAPVVAAPLKAQATEDGQPVTVSALANATDPDGQDLRVVIDHEKSPLRPGVVWNEVNQTFTLDPKDPVFNQLAAGEKQTIVVTYGVSDGQATTSQSLTFNLTGTNDLPVVQVYSVKAVEEASYGSHALVDVNVASYVEVTDSDTTDLQTVVKVNGLAISSLSIQDGAGKPVSLPAGLTIDALKNSFSIQDGHIHYNRADFNFLQDGQHVTAVFGFQAGAGSDLLPQTISLEIDGVSETISATAIDGYVQGATVFYDPTGTGIMQAGYVYATTTTDAQGRFNLDLNGFEQTSSGRIFVINGVDAMTGQVVGQLIAPKGFGVISPLTTLISVGGISQEDLKAALGIDPSIDLATYDPVAAMKTGATEGDRAAAELIFTKQQQVYAVLQSVAKIASESPTGVVDATALSNAAKAVGDALKAAVATSKDGAPADLGQVVVAAVTSVVSIDLDPAVQKAMIDAISGSISNSVQSIGVSYKGLAEALHTVDIAAQGADLSAVNALIAKAQASAAVSQTALLSAVAEVKAVGATATAETLDSLKQAIDKAMLDASEVDGAVQSQTAAYQTLLELAQSSTGSGDGGNDSPAIYLFSQAAALATSGKLPEGSKVLLTGDLGSEASPLDLSTASLLAKAGVQFVQQVANAGVSVTISQQDFIKLGVASDPVALLEALSAAKVTSVNMSGSDLTPATFNVIKAWDDLNTSVVVHVINTAAKGTLTVEGAYKEGASLTASLDAVDVDGSIVSTAYQWQERTGEGSVADPYRWVDIDGRTSASLDIPSDESFVGKTIRVEITTIDAFGGKTVFTNAGGLVANVNDAAEITGDTTGAVKEDALDVTAKGTLKAADVDNEADAFQAVSTETASAKGYGTYTVTADGAWTYTLNNANATVNALNENSESLSDTFTVKSADGTERLVTVTIKGTNDAPSLTSDQAVLAVGEEDGAYKVSAQDLLVGYSDADGQTLSVVNLKVSHGEVEDNGDGTYTITPEANYNGKVELSYGVTDGKATTQATQKVVLAAVNDAPTLTVTSFNFNPFSENLKPGAVVANYLVGDVETADAQLQVSFVGAAPVDANGNQLYQLDVKTKQVTLTAAAVNFVNSGGSLPVVNLRVADPEGRTAQDSADPDFVSSEIYLGQGSYLSLTEAQASGLISAGLNFHEDGTVVLEVQGDNAADSYLSGSAGLLGGLAIRGDKSLESLGVDVLDLQTTGAVHIDESDAIALINAGLTFADNDTNVTLDVQANDAEGSYLTGKQGMLGGLSIGQIDALGVDVLDIQNNAVVHITENN